MTAAVKLKDLPESDALAAIAAWLEQCEDHLALSGAMALPPPSFNLGEAWPMVLAIAQPERLYLHHMNIRQRELHPETLELVASFARALALKLRAAEVKHGRVLGWKTDDWEAECHSALTEHVAKGDPLDVAAYAAFCWSRGWTTAPPLDLWRPIATAPRDGRSLLLCVEGWEPAMGMWFEHPAIKVPGRWISLDPEGVFTSDAELEAYLVSGDYEPTHWQPAPAGPRRPTWVGIDEAAA